MCGMPSLIRSLSHSQPPKPGGWLAVPAHLRRPDAAADGGGAQQQRRRPLGAKGPGAVQQAAPVGRHGLLPHCPAG